MCNVRQKLLCFNAWQHLMTVIIIAVVIENWSCSFSVIFHIFFSLVVIVHIEFAYISFSLAVSFCLLRHKYRSMWTTQSVVSFCARVVKIIRTIKFHELDLFLLIFSMIPLNFFLPRVFVFILLYAKFTLNFRIFDFIQKDYCKQSHRAGHLNENSIW